MEYNHLSFVDFGWMVMANALLKKFLEFNLCKIILPFEEVSY